MSAAKDTLSDRFRSGLRRAVTPCPRDLFWWANMVMVIAVLGLAMTQVERAAERARQAGLNRQLILALATGNLGSARTALLQGADANARSTRETSAERGETPALVWAASVAVAPDSSDASRLEEIVRTLLEHSADVNATDAEGRSALMAASRNGNERIVGLLLRAGADVHTWDIGGKNALLIAASVGRTGVVRTLLRAGADVNAVSWEGQTALIAAASGGHTETVRALLAAGAHTDARFRGDTALKLAHIWNYPETVAALKKAGARE